MIVDKKYGNYIIGETYQDLLNDPYGEFSRFREVRAAHDYLRRKRYNRIDFALTVLAHIVIVGTIGILIFALLHLE
jgi:hypothetical protein